MKTFPLVLVLLLAVHGVCGETWAQGERIVLSVNLSSPLQYSIGVNGNSWFESAPLAIFCNKQWHSEEQKNLVLQKSSTAGGSDPNLGPYQQARLDYVASDASGSTPVSVTFTYYSSMELFLFDTIFPNGASGTAVVLSSAVGESEFNSTSEVSTKFPSFVATPNSFLGSKVGFYEWHGRFSADSNVLATGLYSGGYQGGTEGGPLLLFNTSLMYDRNNADALFISGFSHFKDSIGSLENGTLSFGVQGYAQSFPSGFDVRFGLSGSQFGINAALSVWGANLRKAYNVPKIAAELDPVNHKLSYWTDNGAFYYNGYWGLHKNTTAEEILLSLYTYWEQIEVPIGSIQLDDWWYTQADDQAYACVAFEPNPTLFPNGLQKIHQQISIPLLLYSSCWSTKNTYASKFEFLNSRKFDLPWDQGQVAIITPAQSESFYNYIMDAQNEYLGAFEIDFLDFQYLLFNDLLQEVDSWRTYLEGSARAALNHNVSIQYCMELPNDILQSVEFAAVTSARASDDDFPWQQERWAIGFTSMLHRAVGLGAFFDDFWTTTDQLGNPYNATSPNAELATIISTLSAGPVGISDGIGFTNITRIVRAVRQDGVILKPSVPAIPIDAQFVQPYLKGTPEHSNIWSTYALIDDFVAYYLLAVNCNSPFNLQQSTLWPRANMTSYWVASYNQNYVNGSSAESVGLVKLTDDSPFAIPVQPPSTFISPLSFGLYIITPIFESGWAILGETSKFVTMSPLRVADVNVRNGLSVQLTGAPNENVKFTFVTPTGTILVKSTTLSAQGTGSISAP